MSTFVTTEPSDHPWYQLDMITNHCVRGLKIHSRHSCCADRLGDVEIRIGNQDVTGTIENYQIRLQFSFLSIMADSKLLPMADAQVLAYTGRAPGCGSKMTICRALPKIS